MIYEEQAREKALYFIRELIELTEISDFPPGYYYKSSDRIANDYFIYLYKLSDSPLMFDGKENYIIISKKTGEVENFSR